MKAFTTAWLAATMTITTTWAGSPSPLPSPLDGDLSTNFTSNCAAFISDFLADPTFKQCYPFSMFLQGSNSFFAAEKSLASISRVIQASCSANVTQCTDYLTQLSTALTSPGRCQTDFETGNSVVAEAYAGLTAYAPLYHAACLRDPDTAEYCYARAITNATHPSDAYFYYLPLGVGLPAGTRPSCSGCLQGTMAVLCAAAADRSQPIAQTYLAAAQHADTMCGPAFAQTTLPPPTRLPNEALARCRHGVWAWLAVGAAMGAVWWL